jgi:hypothetical protein
MTCHTTWRFDAFALSLGRVVNLAAEGEATPCQREQQDGDAMGNWGVADSAEERARIIHACSDWLDATQLMRNVNLQTLPCHVVFKAGMFCS